MLALAWPILVSMGSYSVMGLVDSLFVSQLGTSALAAVGLGTSALHLVTALWVGLLGGVRILVAQHVGAEDLPAARRVGWQGLWLALGAGLLVLGTVPFAGALLALVGAGPDLVVLGRDYVAVRLLSGPFVFLTFALQGWFQGRGDTRTPMRAVLAGNLLNIVLDPVLIHGLGGLPALGITGAGLATALAWVVQAVWLGWRATLGLPVRPDRSELRALFRVGLPVGVNHLLDVLAFAVFAVLLASAGEAHVAAHVVVVRVLMTSVLPGHALGEATGVLVGQSLGAGRLSRARRAWWSGVRLATAFMVGVGALFVAVPALLLAPFGVDPEVLDLGTSALTLLGFVQVFDAVVMISLGALNGAGDTRFTLVSGLTTTWLVKVPVAALLVGAGLGIVGAYLGVAAELVVLAFVVGTRVRGAAWLRHVGPARSRV